MNKLEFARFVRQWIPYIARGDLVQGKQIRYQAAKDLLSLDAEVWWKKWGGHFKEYESTFRSMDRHPKRELIELKA